MAGLVTVIGNTTRSECMRDGTDENDDADTTSVTAELRKVAELPNVQRAGDPMTYEYKTQLIDMARALEHRWAKVQAQNEKRMMEKTKAKTVEDAAAATVQAIHRGRATRLHKAERMGPSIHEMPRGPPSVGVEGMMKP